MSDQLFPPDDISDVAPPVGSTADGLHTHHQQDFDFPIAVGPIDTAFSAVGEARAARGTYPSPTVTIDGPDTPPLFAASASPAWSA